MIKTVSASLRICVGSLLLLVAFLRCTEPPSYYEFDPALEIGQNVDSFVNSLIAEHDPGMAILVRKDGEIILSNEYGMADIDQDIPVSQNTPFYLASVSKQFTAMSIMMLEERGLLSYNDPVNTYIHEAPKAWDDISIHHMLTHRSGIPDYLNDLDWFEPDITNQQVLQKLLQQPDLEFIPGEKYDYSNSGYMLLTEIVSRVSDQPFHKFMLDSVFTPLGMGQTLVYDTSKPHIQGRAIGYRSNGSLRDYNLLTMGDGGMFSTIADLDRWEQSFYSNALVDESTKQKAYTSYESDGYGYGWGIREVDGVMSYGHGGGLAGYRTFIGRVPSKKFSIIILSNGSYDWIGALRERIIDTYL